MVGTLTKFKTRIAMAFIAFLLLLNPNSHAQAGPALGQTFEEIIAAFPATAARTYRHDENQTWITFDDVFGDNYSFITYYLLNDEVINLSMNNRVEIVEEYMGEFVSQYFHQSAPQTFQAIKEILLQIPHHVFKQVTQRTKPMLFTEIHSVGKARLANSSDIAVGNYEPPAFQKGMWITKLSTELESSPSVQAIKGVVAHELAHNFLGHTSKALNPIEQEKEANRLIQAWGFTAAYDAASHIFA